MFCKFSKKILSLQSLLQEKQFYFEYKTNKISSLHAYVATVLELQQQ